MSASNVKQRVDWVQGRAVHANNTATFWSKCPSFLNDDVSFYSHADSIEIEGRGEELSPSGAEIEQTQAERNPSEKPEQPE